MAVGVDSRAMSIAFKFALGCLVLAIIFQSVGFSTNNWTSFDFSNDLSSNGVNRDLTTNSGLWRRCYCTVGTCTCLYFETPLPRDMNFIIASFIRLSADTDYRWFQAVRAMETIGLIGLIIAGIVSLISICVGQRGIRILAVFTTFLAGACILTGVIVYGANQLDTVSWSLAFCVVAVFFAILVGILLIIDIKIGHRTQHESDSRKTYVSRTHYINEPIPVIKDSKPRIYEPEMIAVSRRTAPVVVSQRTSPPPVVINDSFQEPRTYEPQWITVPQRTAPVVVSQRTLPPDSFQELRTYEPQRITVSQRTAPVAISPVTPSYQPPSYHVKLLDNTAQIRYGDQYQYGARY